MNDPQRRSIAIDVVSDAVCPWCYIGKRNLEAALADLPELDVELAAAVMVGEDLAQLLDPAQDLHPRLLLLGIAREHQLRDVADPAHGRGHLLWVDGIAQSKDIGIRCHDRQPRPPVAVFDHRTVDQHPLFRGQFQNQPAHAACPSPRNPRMTAVLISISGRTEAPPDSALRLCCSVNSAR